MSLTLFDLGRRRKGARSIGGNALSRPVDPALVRKASVGATAAAGISGLTAGLSGRLLVVLAVALWPLWPAGTAGASAVWASPATDVTLEGTVEAVPGSAGGLGRYQLVDADAELHTFFADENTEFHDDEVPAVGDMIEMEGHWTSSDRLLAERIDLIRRGDSDDDSDGADAGDDGLCSDMSRTEWEGAVVSRPADSPVGTWTVQLEHGLILTVIVDRSTRLDRGIPDRGSWVDVRGQLTDGAGCTVLARRLRPDDIEGGEVVVRLAAGSTPADLLNDEEYQLIFRQTLVRDGNMHLFAIDEDDSDEEAMVRRLNRDERVAWAELNYVGGVPESEGYKTWGWGAVDESGYRNQNAFTQVNLAPALERSTGAGVIVAVLDTGIEPDHPAFSGRLLDGRDLIDDDEDPREVPGGVAWGHGTHISGLVSAIAPEASLLPVRVLDGNGRGNMFTLAYAVEWAVAQGADVINLSLGAEVDSRVLEETIAAAVAEGVVIVAAAGNGDSDVVQYPAGFDGVVSVTAVDDGGVKASFANYGAAWVDVAAPGIGIVSAVPDYDEDGEADYSAWSGTSMAAPFVSGTAALIRQASAESTSTDIERLLAMSSVALDAINTDLPSGALGGLLDISAAAGVAVPDEPTQPEEPADPGAPAREAHQVYLPLIVHR